MSTTDDLIPLLKKLRLSGVLQSLELRTRQAADDDLFSQGQVCGPGGEHGARCQESLASRASPPRCDHPADVGPLPSLGAGSIGGAPRKRADRASGLCADRAVRQSDCAGPRGVLREPLQVSYPSPEARQPRHTLDAERYKRPCHRAAGHAQGGCPREGPHSPAGLASCVILLCPLRHATSQECPNEP